MTAKFSVIFFFFDWKFYKDVGNNAYTEYGRTNYFSSDFYAYQKIKVHPKILN